MSKLFFSSLFLLLSITAFAQTPTPTPEAKDDVVVINTNLIQVDATVTDKSGKIVKDLTADDFEIYENDQKQLISNFSFVELQPDQPTEPTASKPNKNVLPAPPVPNKLKAEQVRRTIALVVDDLGLSFSSIYFVQQALKKFVDEQMQPGDLVAIIRTGSGIGALQQFTSDKRQLHAAIERVKWNSVGRVGISSFAAIEPTLKEIVKDALGTAAELEAQNEANEFRENIFAVGTLGAVNYIVRGMRELPGRKAVMLFSEGFVLFDRNGQNQRVLDALRRLTDLANRSAVVIYTMDARGLVAPGLSAEDNTFGLEVEQVSDRLDQRDEKLLNTQQGLRTLAQQTGGFSIINQNSLNRGIERVLNDQKGYYLIGYEPDDAVFDSKQRRFNKLSVKLKRPDLKVRYRSGFFGITDEAAKPSPKTPVQQILNALRSPFATGEIDLRLTALFTDDAKTGSLMRSLVFIKGDALKFTDDKDGFQKATFDIVAMLFGDNGTIVEEVSRTQNIRAKDSALREVSEKGLVYTVTVQVKKPGAYQMRVVLRDQTSAKIGSANQFIEIPNLKKNRLALSGIIVQRYNSAQPVDETVAPKQLQTDEERDTATRRFKKGTGMIFGYAIYNAKANKTAPQLTTQYKLFQNGTEIYSSNEVPFIIKDQPDLQRLSAVGTMTLGNTMQAGEYVLQIIVRDTLAKEKRQAATQWIDFEITD